VVVLFFRKGWNSLPYIKNEGGHSRTRVSILIAARNEEDKIGNTIEDILSQNYPKELVELIVVDDHSTDRTAEIILSYANKGVILIKLNENQPLNSYKKKAISEAIKKAKGELIVTTDADCRMESNWLKTIVSFYEKGSWKLISSPVVYFEEHSHFEKMQTLEFLYLIGLGASSIGNKVPSTCNGANLAYRKDVFEELKGFQGIDDLASGDDELFLHKVASKYPDSIGFCKSTDAIVFTHAKPNLKEFIRQRKRWASKSTRYKNKSVVALGVSVWLFNLFIFINFLLGFRDADYWKLAVISLVCKFLVEILFLIKVTSFINRAKLLRYLPLLTILHVFYMIYIGLVGNSGKYVWKGRVVR
jgi:cellulose synthase/poly-beta-1,6-N-acetylglucosamine synthase-like glycosyltransferase